MTQETAQLTVYYDGGCPLCRREIGFYQRLDRAGRIGWSDVSRDASALAAEGIGQREALARIYAHQADGRLISGAAVFVAIWRQLPGFRWLAPLAGWTPVLAVLERAYIWFARRRQRLTGRGDACCCARPDP